MWRSVECIKVTAIGHVLKSRRSRSRQSLDVIFDTNERCNCRIMSPYSPPTAHLEATSSEVRYQNQLDAADVLSCGVSEGSLLHHGNLVEW